MDYIVWVGPRDSDCAFDDLFSEHICYFSEGNNCCVRKASIYGSEFNQYIEQRMEKILQRHPNAKFIFYNQKTAYSIHSCYRSHIVCLNPEKLINILADKIYMRYWMGNHVLVLPSLLISSRQLSFEELESHLCPSEEYVIQKNGSSGGFGTFCLSKGNGMLELLREGTADLLIVSPYLSKSYSVNVNAIICEDDILVFAPSLQIVQRDRERLLYHGADYIAAQALPENIRRQITEYSHTILSHIKKMGYLGIIGLDFIVAGQNVYFQEVNPRYQASSFLISRALKEQDAPSLSTLNLYAFYNQPSIGLDAGAISVNYSFYKYFYTHNAKHLYHVLDNIAQIDFPYTLLLDGWKREELPEEDAYCYSIAFATNITSLNYDGGMNLYSNIHGDEAYLQKYKDSPIGLKLALLNQGCILSEEAKAFCEKQGDIKEAVFSAIDFKIQNSFFVNAPVQLKFCNLSPFIIKVHQGSLALFYYRLLISPITVELKPQWNDKYTANKVPYNKIAYLSTDRLRIKHEATCVFKKAEKSCHFCNIPISHTIFDNSDIDEVITHLFEAPNFRHVLIGGGSGDAAQEAEHVIHIAREIRKRNSQMPIYLMSLPPTEESILKDYQQSGITEVAFNIEIWNRQMAQEIMPGKGQIPLERYLHMLKAGTALWGRSGNVRTALIVGLNSTADLLEGIQLLCENGIQPMLSVFRPMKNTPLENVVPPSNSALLHTYHAAQAICQAHQLRLGPTCDACKNNMLAL